MEKSLISASQQNLDQKLEPPPSPPALLLAQSTGSEPSTLTCDINTNKLMNPPPQPPLFFQSSLSQKAKSMLKGTDCHIIFENILYLLVLHLFLRPK